ncbi:MAG TPA: MFS transporter [Opitutaceae bacterium]|nr:MFS transporter [Opitutaceae bacterium]
MPTLPATAVSAPLAAPPSSYRWVICGLLFAATTATYADRQILALLKPALDHALHWTNREYGAVNAAFQVSYAVGTVFFGWLVDRIGVKLGFVASSLCSAVAALSHAFVSSVGGFAGARFALGVGAGGNFPAAVKTVALWFQPEERALATAIFNAGSNVGAIASPVIVPVLVARFGWRSTFVVASMIGACWVTGWYLLYRPPGGRRLARRLSEGETPAVVAGGQTGDPDRAAGGTGPGRGATSARRISWADLLRCRDTWSFIVPKCMTDPVWGLLLIWLPDYFKQAHHRDLAQSWVELASIYAIVTVVSLLGGWLPEALIRRGWPVSRARFASLFAAAVFALPITGAGFVGVWGAVVLIGIAGAAHQAWSANLFTLASDLFPPQAVASVVGLGGLMSALGVSVFSVLSGAELDFFQARGKIATGYHVLFGGFALTYGAALLAHHLIANGWAIRGRDPGER